MVTTTRGAMAVSLFLHGDQYWRRQRALLCGWLADAYGWSYGWGYIGMLFGLLIFNQPEWLEGKGDPSHPSQLLEKRHLFPYTEPKADHLCGLRNCRVVGLALMQRPDDAG